MSKLKLIALFLIVVLILSYCKDNDFFYSEVEIPDGIWESNKAIIFQPEIKDTTQLFNINLSITNSNVYRYSNIWFFIKSVSPEGFSQTDTVEVFIAEDDGKWFGRKKSDMYTLDIRYKEKIRFPVAGNYKFEIIQGMRDLKLNGIYKLGFSLQYVTNP